jgi:hypothetical protein
MKTLIIQKGNLLLHLLVIILVGFVFAIIGFIVAANLSSLFELISGQPFVINGREGYEAAGPIGFVGGALSGLVISSFFLIRMQTKKTTR